MGAVRDVVVLLAGAAVVILVFLSAVSTVVVPRGVPVRLTRGAFQAMRTLFGLRVRMARSYEAGEHAMALYAPLSLVTLIITYLPSMYAAFTRREAQVAMVAVFAGEPPSAVELIARFHSLADLDRLELQLWIPWTGWPGATSPGGA